jgi:prepilin-type N-terminal cleavage/methylation domain-containing protein/prepilin-type processing-associated H-X9-DG protein
MLGRLDSSGLTKSVGGNTTNMLRRRRGFTLIELLVVIAIIGILAAMVFPVFARARESARKAVCLSNVKNIALAFQMYFADNNDAMPPEEHRQEAIDYFNTGPGGKPWTRSTDCHRVRQANPYLRVPVILDEYIKNRDVWRCPSAKVEGGAGGIIPVQDWLQFLMDNEGSWGTTHDLAPCGIIWPAGWGGSVTDTIAQERVATGADKAFTQSIGTLYAAGQKMVQVNDPVNNVICCDAGVITDDFSAETLAYPDICCLGCSDTCGWADWEICSSAADCGLYDTAPNNGAFLKNPELVKPYARHLGGVNLGFWDGHASWISSRGLLNKIQEGDIENAEPWGPTSDDPPSCYPDAALIW